MISAVETVKVPQQKLFSAREAARYLGVSRSTLRHMTDEGELKAYRFRNRVAYRVDELDSYIERLDDYNGACGGSPLPRRSEHGRK